MLTSHILRLDTNLWPQIVHRELLQTGAAVSSSFFTRNSRALIATMTVDADMRIAPTSDWCH